MSPFPKFKRKIQKVVHTKLQYRHLKHFTHVLVQPNLLDIILKKMFLKSPLKLMKEPFFLSKNNKDLGRLCMNIFVDKLFSSNYYRNA